MHAAEAADPSRPPVQLAPARALVAEHDPAARRSYVRALRSDGLRVTGADSGEAALLRLSRSSYDVLVAGMFLPDMSGLDLLDRAREAAPGTPVVLTVPFGSIPLARRARAADAAGWVTHPCGPYDLAMAVERVLGRTGRGARSDRGECSDAEAALDVLVSAIQMRGAGLHGNSERVAAYALHLAVEMDLSAEDMRDLERGALLNGIGLLAVPDRILLKPGPLTEAEWEEVKAHPAVGFRMCAPIASLKGAARIVLHHHERWDGSGYPDGLAGEDIPLGARILAVAVTFDAMTSERPHRSSRTCKEAADEIRRCAGTQFDPAVVERFLDVPISRWRQIRDLFPDWR